MDDLGFVERLFFKIARVRLPAGQNRVFRNAIPFFHAGQIFAPRDADRKRVGLITLLCAADVGEPEPAVKLFRFMRAFPAIVAQGNRAICLPCVPVVGLGEGQNFSELRPVQQIIAAREEGLVADLVADGDIHHIPMFAAAENRGAVHQLVRVRASDHDAVFERRFHRVKNLRQRVGVHEAAGGNGGKDGAFGVRCGDEQN